MARGDGGARLGRFGKELAPRRIPGEDGVVSRRHPRERLPDHIIEGLRKQAKRLETRLGEGRWRRRRKAASPGNTGSSN